MAGTDRSSRGPQELVAAAIAFEEELLTSIEALLHELVGEDGLETVHLLVLQAELKDLSETARHHMAQVKIAVGLLLPPWSEPAVTAEVLDESLQAVLADIDSFQQSLNTLAHEYLENLNLEEKMQALTRWLSMLVNISKMNSTEAHHAIAG